MKKYIPKTSFLLLKIFLVQKLALQGAMSLFVATLISASAFSQTDSFKKMYGGIGSDRGYSVQQTSDSGYIVAGYTNSYGPGMVSVYLLKTYANGDTAWTKTYGGGSDDYGYDIRQTADSGYCIAGHTSSFGSGGADVYLVKTNSAGEELWTKTYGGTSSDFGYGMDQTADSGFVIVGQTYSYGSGGADVYLIKTNALGDTLWTRTYGGSNYDVAYSVQQTNDGGYILTGWTYSFGAGGDMYLIKTNSSGDTLWTKIFGGSNAEESRSVRQTADSGYIVAGWTESYGAGSEDCYLIKTDSQGDTLWTKTFGGGGNDRAYTVRQTEDEGYIIAGQTKSYGNGLTDVYLVKTDMNGSVLWSRTIGRIDFDEAYGMDLTADGGFVMTGTSYTLTPPFSYDLYLVKTNSSGLVGVFDRTIVDVPQQFQLFQNYPNPFNPVTTISYNVAFPSFVNIKVYDVLGREIVTLVQEHQNAGTYAIPFNGSGLASGIYFYRLEATERGGPSEQAFVSVKKMVILK